MWGITTNEVPLRSRLLDKNELFAGCGQGCKGGSTLRPIILVRHLIVDRIGGESYSSYDYIPVVLGELRFGRPPPHTLAKLSCSSCWHTYLCMPGGGMGLGHAHKGKDDPARKAAHDL